ncbi:ABC transporter permease [Halomonas salipaludis]|uniref:ABC transporter permease n=2 Tax=Halomonas salipaludis TaxID=2032625 RepID=A0A2A2EW42_9GAMM|nr:ABC transporter permease [Halomonas salipaludis]
MLFLRLGALPFIMLVALITFTIVADNFLTANNIANILRQSSYLVIVAVGQMLTLLTGGFDLSVGTIMAFSSVVGALTMTWSIVNFPDAIVLSILLGIVSGVLSGILIGTLNGIGVAVFNVSPFIMTMGMASVGFGLALYMTGGVPVYGIPMQFSDIFGYGRLLGVSTPVWIAILLSIILFVLVHKTRLGRHLYAVGGNIKAAQLSGINTQRGLFRAYVLCGVMAALAGLLMTARLDTGDANIGVQFPLESIAACVIAGVSLRGGIGRVENVVLGALLIGVFKNGMNLSGVDSYMQTVVIGALLIFAVVMDQFRLKLLAKAA